MIQSLAIFAVKAQMDTSDISDGFRPQFQEVSQPLNHAARAIALALMDSSTPFYLADTQSYGKYSNHK